MPLSPSDLRFYLSVRNATAGYTAASTPNGALGGYLSISRLDTGLGALFGDSAQASVNVPNYRCVFLANTHPTLPLINPEVYLDAVSDAKMAFALDLIAAAVQPDARAAVIPDELTAPTMVSEFFESPAGGGGGVPIESLPPGFAKAIWIRRTSAVALNPTAGCTLGVRGTTDLHLVTWPA